MVATSNRLIVVGDRFAEFLANPGTVMASQLPAENVSGVDVVAGQGLSAQFLAELGKRWDVPVPARRELTHKRVLKNVMIGEPYQADGRYVAPLVLDECNETLEDHLTGQHIPAVALTEAARQMWTAVTEMSFLNGLPATRFVIDEVRSRFRGFVFPLPALLVYEVHEHERSAIQQLFRGTVEIRQAGVVTTEFDVRFRVITEKLSVKQEAMAAKQALAEVMAADTRVREESQA